MGGTAAPAGATTNAGVTAALLTAVAPAVGVLHATATTAGVSVACSDGFSVVPVVAIAAAGVGDDNDDIAWTVAGVCPAAAVAVLGVHGGGSAGVVLCRSAAMAEW